MCMYLSSRFYAEMIFLSLQVDFEGLTGRVSFDSRGYRNNYKLDLFTVTMDMGPFKVLSLSCSLYLSWKLLAGIILRLHECIRRKEHSNIYS